MSTKSLPRQVSVAEVIRSRYPYEDRPLSWDERIEGIDVIRTSDDEVIRLFSDGMQSPPKKGWVVVLTGGSDESGYSWTLYGIPRGARVSQNAQNG
jgi:hypothetical protein